MEENGTQPEQVIVDMRALNALLNFITQAPLPFGRDGLVKAVADSARPVVNVIEKEGTEA